MNIDSLTHILPKEISSEILKFQKLDHKFKELFNEKTKISDADNLVNKLKDCGVKRINIDEGDWQKKYNIVVVPTIIIFNGEEVKRYQADLSFTIAATRKEVQNTIDEIIMSDF